MLAPVARAAPVLSGMQLTAPVAVAVAVVITVVVVVAPLAKPAPPPPPGHHYPDLAALGVNTVEVVVEEEIRTAVEYQEWGPQEAKELSRFSMLPVLTNRPTVCSTMRIPPMWGHPWPP